MTTNPRSLKEVFSHTLYINLDSRPDRLEHVRQELAKIGIGETNAQRISAIKTPNGALGCTLSHIRSLEEAMAADVPCVFICEDDITFTNPPLFRQNLAAFLEIGAAWDVIIVGGNLCPPYGAVTINNGVSNTTANFCCRVFNCQTTTGYIVARHYYSILLANFRKSAEALARGVSGREAAIDISWKSLQPTGAWYMIMPATVTQYENYSDIERRVVQYDALMLDTEKKWLHRSMMNQ